MIEIASITYTDQGVFYQQLIIWALKKNIIKLKSDPQNILTYTIKELVI